MYSNGGFEWQSCLCSVCPSASPGYGLRQTHAYAKLQLRLRQNCLIFRKRKKTSATDWNQACSIARLTIKDSSLDFLRICSTQRNSFTVHKPKPTQKRASRIGRKMDTNQRPLKHWLKRLNSSRHARGCLPPWGKPGGAPAALVRVDLWVPHHQLLWRHPHHHMPFNHTGARCHLFRDWLFGDHDNDKDSASGEWWRCDDDNELNRGCQRPTWSSIENEDDKFRGEWWLWWWFILVETGVADDQLGGHTTCWTSLGRHLVPYNHK